MASDGYTQAGYEVTGVDINPQPHYPYPFQQANALEILVDDAIDKYDVIHASPPCQAFTRAKTLRKAQGKQPKYGDLLTPVIELLQIKWAHKTWVVENVPGAPGMAQAITQCGSSYGLGVRRHRLFLSNRPLTSSQCDHKAQGRPWGVYYAMNDQIPKGGRTVTSLEHGLEVMGVTRYIPWEQLKEGFPPAYTFQIGLQLQGKR